MRQVIELLAHPGELCGHLLSGALRLLVAPEVGLGVLHGREAGIQLDAQGFAFQLIRSFQDRLAGLDLPLVGQDQLAAPAQSLHLLGLDQSTLQRLPPSLQPLPRLVDECLHSGPRLGIGIAAHDGGVVSFHSRVHALGRLVRATVSEGVRRESHHRAVFAHHCRLPGARVDGGTQLLQGAQ